MNLVLFACNMIYLAAIAYKFVTIVKHALWINIHGPKYKIALDNLRKATGGNATPADIYKVTTKKKFREKWVPKLGIKEFAIKNKILEYKQKPGVQYIAKRWALRLVVIIYDFASLGVIGGALLAWTGIQIRTSEHYGALAKVASLMVVLVLVLTLFALAIEPSVIYARLGSYAMAFQSPLKYVNRKRTQINFIFEVSVLASLAFALAYVDTGIVFLFANAGYDSFQYPSLIGWNGLFHCTYAALMTFVFSSPLTPTTNFGQFVQLVFTCQGILVLTVALAGLYSLHKTPK